MTPPGHRRDWDDVPCGLLTLRPDGTVDDVNGTALDWVGRTWEEVVGRLRLPELLTVGGRIYWETHLALLLRVDGRVDEVALELRGSGGRLPVLMTAVAEPGGGRVRVVLSRAQERSRYERELVAARAAAERSAVQVRTLQQVTAALSQAVGVEAVGTALLDASTGPLAAAAATLFRPDAERVLSARGARGEPLGAARLPAAGLVLHERRAVRDAGRVVVPLHGGTTLQGVLSLAATEAPAAEPLDLEVLTAVGQQAGLALDRAELYEQSASVAHQLQHSLLAVDPPRDSRFKVAAVYRPGVELLEVGGDWYDVFLAGDGVLSVVVGDVVGRGLGAASAMGQLRSAVRAVAGPGVGPAQLLTRLDRFVEQVESAAMATLAYAEIELESGHVRYACAGHPPPMLLSRVQENRLLWGGRSTPLGAFLPGQRRGEADLQLEAGDRLLLYTDGLVERRGRSLDVGLDLLCRAASQVQHEPLPEAVREVTDTLLLDETGRDDVCVLLLDWGGQFERTLPADLTQLSAVRRAFGAWLTECGVDERVRADLVLAASEALANASEHGARKSADEQVVLRARLEQAADGGQEVVVSVHDEGRWRAASPSPERGRGLRIMTALVDDVVVEKTRGTTVVLRRRLEGCAR